MRVLVAASRIVIEIWAGIVFGFLLWRALVMLMFLYDICFDLFKSLGL